MVVAGISVKPRAERAASPRPRCLNALGALRGAGPGVGSRTRAVGPMAAQAPEQSSLSLCSRDQKR